MQRKTAMINESMHSESVYLRYGESGPDLEAVCPISQCWRIIEKNLDL